MQLQLKTDYNKTLSYARTQNGIPCVRSIVVRNTTTLIFNDVHVRISFDPAFAGDYENVIAELGPGGRAVLDNIPVRPSASFLVNLTERIEGTMKVTASCAGEELFSEELPLTMLPYDFWEGVGDVPELLASFCVPNHPAIRPILKRAAEKLGRWTGNPSFNGYQSGDPNRVKQTAAAIYEALREQGLTYCEPPASFADQGQRVRLPEDILSSGLATCLDTSLLYAGCLEAVGLRPLVILEAGHAYAGCWLVEKSSPYPVNDDPAMLRKNTADGINEIVLVETTMFLKGIDSQFEDASKCALGHLNDIDRFILHLDIRSARNIGILPLPLRVLTPEGFVIDEETVRKREVPDRLPDSDDIDIDSAAKVDKHTIWERKLLDLSMRNDLLNIHARRGPMQLMSSSPADTVRMFEEGCAMHIYASATDSPLNLLTDSIFAEISPDHPLSSYAHSELKDSRLHSFLPEELTFTRLDKLRLDARHSIEENGANSLFLAVGALKWMDEDSGKPHFAPILLVPVEITKSTWSIKSTGEDVTANLTLLEMLRQQHSISVPGLDDLPEKDGVTDVQKVLNIIRKAIMDKKGWDVLNLMFLGNFTFNKFIIWNDIHTHRDMLDGNPAVSSLVEGRLKVKDINPEGDGNIDAQCPSGTILRPISADSSQLRAIRDAVAGRSFVMHGPPGTGKSQTITNIIANYLYNGKRVLFVSEKMAALDVVRKRLEDIGLAPFCLELHSNKARKSAVLAKLDETLSLARNEAPATFEADAAKMDEFSKFINDHAESLHRVYPSGFSLYECLSRYMSLPENVKTRRLPAGIINAMKPTMFKDMEQAVEDYITAIRHTGIDSTCQLLDFPPAEYTPDFQEKTVEALTSLLGKQGLRFWWSARKFESRLGHRIGVTLSADAMKEVRSKLGRWLEASDNLKKYAIYSRQKANLCGIGLAMVAEEYECGNIKEEEIMPLFEKSFFKSCAEYIMNHEKNENLFCGDIFESAVKKFREMDKAFRETTCDKIASEVAARLPVQEEEAAKGTEMAILKKAIRNNARGISLRNLFGKIPTLLPRICPCMLMSPLSVSQYLEARKGMFDLVIFDEASQLPTSEAVAAIARGKSLVVVGDPRQLPPTSFFETNIYDEENAEKEDLESILDEYLAISLPSVHLRWHYRSRHESLIAFSNANYYGGKLLTFPSNDDLSTRVTYRQVDGLYDRGRTRTNATEADAVVAEVRRRLKDPELCRQSIGIITFNVSQQHLIEAGLEEMFSKNKPLAKIAAEQAEPIFVKSLENVQGDERDTILFSIGYGHDRSGKVSMNFGPINQDGGWRRLNVAVSRARDEMVVFSSLQPEEISGSGFVPRGVSDLKAFLKYARDGRETLESATADSQYSDLFVEKIAQQLRQSGLEVNTGIGTSSFRIDIGVVDRDNPGCYGYGIICDGPCYASAESASDREITRPAVLEGLGWTIKRIWILDRYGN